MTLANTLECWRSESTSCSILHLNHTLVSSMQHASSLYTDLIQIRKIQVTLHTVCNWQRVDCFSETEMPHTVTTVSADGYSLTDCHTAGILQWRWLLHPLDDWLKYFAVVKKLAARRLLLPHLLHRHRAAGKQKNAYQRHVSSVDGIHEWPV